MKINHKNYYRNTPVRMRKLGDALLACTQGVSGGITVNQLISAGPVSKDVLWFSLVLMGIGVIGKFLTNFYSED